MIGMESRILLCPQANAIADERAVYDRTFDNAGGGADTDSVANIVSDDRVPDVQFHVVGLVNEDSFVCKSEDHAVLNVHFLGLQNVHATNAVAESVNGKTPDRDHIGIRRIDDDARGKGRFPCRQ